MFSISTGVKGELKSNNTVINTKFKNLTDFEDIANLLEIPAEFLWKILIRDKKINYRMFKLHKKNGNERTIYSPSKNLAILQKKLAYILTLNFNNHKKSHGFVKTRSIVSNASEHINKKFILNFDLENFFESIQFRRVRYMFIAYFKFNDNVASTLANICCHPKSFLPQGAATSPIISNILAKSLDKELTRVAQHTKWSQYTRYADDITFSTNKKHFPKEIAYVDNEGNVVLNENIVKIVEKYGFKINPEKTRLQNHRQRQSVTGIVVNEKLNINRTYIRRIRSILNCIEKNLDNIVAAEKLFQSKYPFRQKKDGDPPCMFLVLRGMISHVGHVKGKQDKVFLKLSNRYNNIAQIFDKKIIKLPQTKKDFQGANTFIIDSDDFEYCINKDDSLGEFLCEQGTGFYLRGIGLITNAHVIKEAIDIVENKLRFVKEFYITFYKYNETETIKRAKILCYDIVKDIAILEVENVKDFSKGYMFNESIEEGQRIELIGFPNYRKGQDIRTYSGFVQGIRMHEAKYKRYEISTLVYGGNSGGPIVNDNNEVIGVAVKGLTDNGVSPNEMIPISEVIELAREKNLKVEHELA